jgi:hypothetical protein
VMVEISNELKLGVGHVRRVQDWRMRNAVPPPITDEVLEEETGRGLLMRVKPGGVASSSSAEVVLGETQVSVRAKRSTL